MITGNYTFFNILTIALCLTLIDDAAWKRMASFISAFWVAEEPDQIRMSGTEQRYRKDAFPSTGTEHQPFATQAGAEPHQAQCRLTKNSIDASPSDGPTEGPSCKKPFTARLESLWMAHPWWTITVLGLLPLVLSALKMFKVAHHPFLDLHFTMGPADLQPFVAALLPWTLAYWGCQLTLTSAAHIIGVLRSAAKEATPQQSALMRVTKVGYLFGSWQGMCEPEVHFR